MFVFLISLTLLYLSFSNGDPLLEEGDVYHTLFGKIGSVDDLFLKEPNEPAPSPAPDAVPGNDSDILDEPDLEIADTFGFLRTNLTNQTFDIRDFFIINEKYSNFAKGYKNKMKKHTRRKSWDDPTDIKHKDAGLEPLKKQQVKMILVQFTMHCRYEVGKALSQRDFIRDDKRYKLGYLFNRMRRLKTEQLKMVGIATADKRWHHELRNMHALMRLYERVVHFDVDMRDTADRIKEVYRKFEIYDTFSVKKKKKT